MSQERLTMRKIREILRLHHDKQLSQRAIARACRVSHSTVKEYLTRSETAGLSWPLPEGLSEDDLYRKLYPEKTPAAAVEKKQPDWNSVKKELARKHVTLKLLWTEYREQHPEGYGYSQYCDLYRQWKQRLEPSMRQSHKAGEKLFVDYTGDKVQIIDPETGEIRLAEIFVGVMGHSNYTYAEAQFSQDLQSWVGGHIRMFAFLGGVPEVVVPDNLKAGVKAPNFYDPELNPTYQELAEHYGVAVLPARVRKPKDKAKVEVGVQVVERWIMARLRDEQFFSLAQLNQRIQELLRELNNRPMVQLKQSRREVFEAVDRPALHPLPEKPFQFFQHKIVRVNVDYHVEFDKHYYSVPDSLLGAELRLRATETLVEIFQSGQHDPVAVHPRSYVPGRHTTRKEHMPPKHQRASEWNPERFESWAAKVGPYAVAFVQATMKARRHPEQAYRTCLGVLGLAKQHGNERLNEACRQAVESKQLAYREVKSLLEDLPPTGTTPPNPPNHPNLRGGDYYQ